MLLLRYLGNVISGIGRREAVEIWKSQFCLFRSLLTNIRPNALTERKDTYRLSVQGTRPRHKANYAIAAEELDIIKSLHQARKQHVKSLADIMVSFDSRIRQRKAHDQDPAGDRW